MVMPWAFMSSVTISLVKQMRSLPAHPRLFTLPRTVSSNTGLMAVSGVIHTLVACAVLVTNAIFFPSGAHLGSEPMHRYVVLLFLGSIRAITDLSLLAI